MSGGLILPPGLGQKLRDLARVAAGAGLSSLVSILDHVALICPRLGVASSLPASSEPNAAGRSHSLLSAGLGLDARALLDLEGFVLDEECFAYPANGAAVSSPPPPSRVADLVAAAALGGDSGVYAAVKLGVFLELFPVTLGCVAEAGGVAAFASCLLSRGTGRPISDRLLLHLPLYQLFYNDGDGRIAVQLARSLAPYALGLSATATAQRLASLDPADVARGAYDLHVLAWGCGGPSRALELLAHPALGPALLRLLASSASARVATGCGGASLGKVAAMALLVLLHAGGRAAAVRASADGFPAALGDLAAAVWSHQSSPSSAGRGSCWGLRAILYCGLALSSMLQAGVGTAPCPAVAEQAARPDVLEALFALARDLGRRPANVAFHEPLAALLVSACKHAPMGLVTPYFVAGGALAMLEGAEASSSKLLAASVLRGMAAGMPPDLAAEAGGRALAVLKHPAAGSGPLGAASLASDVLADLCKSPAVRPGIVKGILEVMAPPSPAGRGPLAPSPASVSAAASALYKIAGRTGTRPDLLDAGVIPATLRLLEGLFPEGEIVPAATSGAASSSSEAKAASAAAASGIALPRGGASAVAFPPAVAASVAASGVGILLRLIQHPPARAAMVEGAGGEARLAHLVRAVGEAAGDDKLVRSTVDTLVRMGRLNKVAAAPAPPR